MRMYIYVVQIPLLMTKWDNINAEIRNEPEQNA